MTRHEVKDLIVWSMWQKRLRPWHEVSKGDFVWLVESHASGRRVGWLTQLKVDPLHSEYVSHQDAALQVKAAFGLPVDVMLEEPYTEAAASGGYLLACQPAPVYRVDIPLPKALRLNQMGWTAVDAMSNQELQELGMLH